jgi:hypothetical protein
MSRTQGTFSRLCVFGCLPCPTQSFLSLCQGNHYQFDTLRRAKHSSMMVLYHIHNPNAPAFASTCNVCNCELEAGAGYRSVQAYVVLIVKDGACMQGGSRCAHINADQGNDSQGLQSCPACWRAIKQAGGWVQVMQGYIPV